jgi:hypothetical protein
MGGGSLVSCPLVHDGHESFGVGVTAARVVDCKCMRGWAS